MNKTPFQVAIIAGHDHGQVEAPGCTRVVKGTLIREVDITKQVALLTCQLLRAAGVDATVIPGSDVVNDPYHKLMKDFHDASDADRILFLHLHVDSSDHESRLFMHDYRSKVAEEFAQALRETNPVSPIQSNRVVSTKPKTMLADWEAWKSRAYGCICGAYSLPRGFAILIEMFDIQQDANLVYVDEPERLAKEICSSLLTAIDKTILAC